MYGNTIKKSMEEITRDTITVRLHNKLKITIVYLFVKSLLRRRSFRRRL